MQLPQLHKDNESVRIEGFEDVDIITSDHIEAVQCKCYERTSSVVILASSEFSHCHPMTAIGTSANLVNYTALEYKEAIRLHAGAFRKA